jgi:hypothetical protein
LRRRDELGSPVTILPYGHDIAGKTRSRSAFLEGSMPGMPLLHRSAAIQPRFKKYDDQVYVLNVDLGSLVSMNINLTYHSFVCGLSSRFSALYAFPQRQRFPFRNQAVTASDLNTRAIEKFQVRGVQIGQLAKDSFTTGLLYSCNPLGQSAAEPTRYVES